MPKFLFISFILFQLNCREAKKSIFDFSNTNNPVTSSLITTGLIRFVGVTGTRTGVATGTGTGVATGTGSPARSFTLGGNITGLTTNGLVLSSWSSFQPNINHQFRFLYISVC